LHDRQNLVVVAEIFPPKSAELFYIVHSTLAENCTWLGACGTL